MRGTGGSVRAHVEIPERHDADMQRTNARAGGPLSPATRSRVRRTTVPRVMCVTALALVGAVAACDEGEFGGSVPVQPLPSAVPGERTDLTGTIVVQDNGCIDLDLGSSGRRWIVWPYDVVQNRPGPPTEIAVQVDGHDLVDGDRISGVGALVEASELPGWSDADSDLGSFGRLCSADEQGVVVFDSTRLIDAQS